MEDFFKKFVYTGVGLMSMTADKFQKSIDKLVDENKISTGEGKKIVDDFFKKTQGKREEFESQIRNVVEEVVAKFQLPKKKAQEFEKLSKRVAALEEKLANLTKAKADKKKANTEA